MKLCPHCQTVFSDTEFYCTSDGTRLLENYPNPISSSPQFGGSLPPNSFNPPPTVQFGQPEVRSLDEIPTVVQPSFMPPTQPPRSETNANKNIIIAVLATASVFLLIGMLFLIINNNIISKENENNIRPSSNTERESNDSANSNNKSSDDNSDVSNSKSDKQDDIDANDKSRNEDSDTDKKTDDIGQSLPNNVAQQFSGSSRFPSKTLPLTLSLTRNGKSLYGSAQTPDDYDDLSGTVQPNGSFYLKGYNPKFGRVTGIWRGKISENGQVTGNWTSTIDGTNVSFSARRSR